jgi:DNA polymerase-3 subunit gamma/tau
MVLVRIAYVADMPTPDEAIRMIEQNGGASAAAAATATPRGAPAASASSSAASSSSSATSTTMRSSGSAARAEATARPQAVASVQEQPSAPVRALRSFLELVAFASEKRDLMIKGALEADVRLVKFEDGRLEIALEAHAPRALVSDLTRKLEMWTGRRWTVIVSNAAGQPTLREQNLAAKGQREAAAEADPRVREVLARFPGAKVIEVRQLAPEPPESDISADAEDADNLGPGPDSDDP